MGIGDAFDKAKDFAGENSEQVDQGIDAATDQVKDRVPDEHADKVDQGADAARDKLGLGEDSEEGEEGEEGGE